MKAWELEQIRRGSQSKWVTRGGRTFNGTVCTDSRLAKAGDLFVAIAGKKFDAHGFLEQVISVGVAAVLVHKVPGAEILEAAGAKDVAILQTYETVTALNGMAAVYRQEMRAKVITVSGSNGKTTTKRILHTLLGGKIQRACEPEEF